MDIKEMIKKANEASPDALGKIPNAKAAQLLREVFKQVALELQST